MAAMAPPSRSAGLVGRDRELRDLIAAIEVDDPERPVILVVGEAGIGKTRLLAELSKVLTDANRSTPSPRIVRGSCLRLAEAELPFAPILEVLDGLRTVGASGRVDALRASLAGLAPDQPVASGADARTGRFIEIHDLLLAAAAEAGSLVVVLDDLHWADRSTLDLVVFLARRLRGSHAVVVAAYRSDELHRRHPLRPVVAELSRGFTRLRIELDSLPADAVLAQISQLGESIGPAAAESIVARADGNPFHVEELVSLGRDTRRLPASLRDVLLARLESLDPGSLRVLRAAAVIGRPAGVELLGAVSGLTPAELDGPLGETLERSLLVRADEGRSFRFRHALLEEAVLDDLLPGDRLELHRRLAGVLRDRPDLRQRSAAVAAAELARHLDLGGLTEAAADAHLEAADLAVRALAWSEAAAAFDRASELLIGSDVPDTDARLASRVDVIAKALDWSGQQRAAIGLLRSWIARTEAVGDRSAAGSFWLALSRVLNDAGDEEASQAAVIAADQLTAGDPLSPTRVDVLIGRTSSAWLRGHSREAVALGTEAVEGAEAIGDGRLLVRALGHRGASLIDLGLVDQGEADFLRARAYQDQHGWLDTFGVTITNRGVSLANIGEVDAAIAVLEEGLVLGASLGAARSWDPWNLAVLAMCEFLRGRWDRATSLIATARAFEAVGMPTVMTEVTAAMLSAGRGDWAAAERSIDRAAAEATGFVSDDIAWIEFARAARCGAIGDMACRLVHAEAGIAALEGCDDISIRSHLAAVGAGAAADLAEDELRLGRLRGPRDAPQRAAALAALAASIADGTLVPGSASVPMTRANALVAEAEAARASGKDRPSGWQAAADALEALGLRPRVAYVQLRLANTLLRSGDRAAAETALRDARDLAAEIGMPVLEQDIANLARAGRLGIEARHAVAAPPADAPGEADPWGLSPRERDVLELLANGRTNAEIGEMLFISPKTASVHVTHILNKLGVSTRTEAALAAARVDRSGAGTAAPGAIETA